MLMPLMQERLRQQAIKDAEKERAQFYAKQKEGQKDVRAKYREKVRAVWFGLEKKHGRTKHQTFDCSTRSRSRRSRPRRRSLRRRIRRTDRGSPKWILTIRWHVSDISKYKDKDKVTFGNILNITNNKTITRTCNLIWLHIVRGLQIYV